MNATLYLSVNPFETRVAQRENSRLVSYRAERHRASSLVGNLYRGRVTRVLPGMQVAFVDIGLERDGFLHVSDLVLPGETPLRSAPAVTDGGEPDEGVEAVAPIAGCSSRSSALRRVVLSEVAPDREQTEDEVGQALT